MSIDLEKYRDVANRWEQSEQPFAAAAACLIVQLCDEVARLRMTDAEREAIGTAARIAGAVGESDVKATLRAFLERHAKGGEE